MPSIASAVPACGAGSAPAVAAESARRRHFRPLMGAVVGLLLALLGGAPVAAAAPPAIGLDEITPGMTGYGLTVFRGARIDTFGVTVVGVQRNVRVDGSLLLVEVAGHGLELSSIAQGMSGSPIYLDGRFAGALAFGWSGSLKPIAGVTPAAEMLALPAEIPTAGAPRSVGATALSGLMRNPDAGAVLAAELGAGDRGTTAATGPAGGAAPEGVWPDPAAMWTRLAAGLADHAPGFAPAGTGWLLQATGSASGSTSGSGEAAAAAPPTLAPGAACAVPLVTGDAALGAIGTVTWVDGDRVLMMGHPFMQRGPVNLPLATAEIHTILPSREMSFKMGTVGAPVGAVHHDLRAGLAGRLGPAPAPVPMRVTVTGEGGDHVYEFGLAEDPLLTPTLVFWALYNALLTAGDDASLQTVGFDVRSTWSGAAALADAPLVQRGVAAGPGGAAGLAREIMAPLTALLNNPHAPLRLTGVEARLERRRPLRRAVVRSLVGPRTVVRAGEEAEFLVELDLGEGRTETVPFAVALPAHLAPGPYRVVAASAADLFGLETQRAPGRFQPVNLDGLLDVLRLPRENDVLALAILAPGASLVVQGRELAHLPESVAQTVRAGNLQVQRSLADYVWRQDRPLEFIVAGHAVRHLEIKAAPAPRADERRP